MNLPELHIPVVCDDCSWIQESELTRRASETEASMRTVVPRLPLRDGTCSKCGNPTYIPAARYENTESGTLVFALDPGPAMTVRDIQRRRALLHVATDEWSEARQRAHLGTRIPPLEDATPRYLTDDQRRLVKQRFMPDGDDAADCVLISQSAKVALDLVDTLPSVLDLLGTVKGVGLNTIPEPELGNSNGASHDSLDPDTYLGGAVARAWRLARHRLGVCEDHLESLAETIRAKRASTCFVIAKACGELAGQSLWLLEPKEPRQIAARYLIDRWNGLRALALLRPNHADRLRRQATEEAEQLLAEQPDFDIGWNDDWPRQVDRMGKPNYIDDVIAAFPREELGEDAYRMLAGVGHGTEYGIDGLLATYEGRQVIAVSGGQLATVIRLAVWPYGLALRRYGEVAGHEASEGLQHLDTILDLVKEYLTHAVDFRAAGSDLKPRSGGRPGP